MSDSRVITSCTDLYQIVPLAPHMKWERKSTSKFSVAGEMYEEGLANYNAL